MTQRLVVLTGLPGSGKTMYARYLESRHGFQYIGTHQMREIGGYSYNPDFDRLPGQQRKEFLERERQLFRSIHKVTRRHMTAGRDVVIDSCAPENRTRDFFLDPKLNYFPPRDIERILVYVKVDEDVLLRINRRNGRDGVGSYLEGVWEEPVEGNGYSLVTLNYNQSGDFEDNLTHLAAFL